MNTETIRQNAVCRFFNSTTAFRFVFLSSLFFQINDFFSPLSWAIMVWSVYLFCRELIKGQHLRKIRHRKILYFFMGAALLTVIINFRENLAGNLYVLYWLSLCFFFFYGLHADHDHEHRKHEAVVLLDFISGMTTLAMIVGLVLLAVFPKGLHMFDRDFAIYENRFVGIIVNANVLAFYAVMAIVATHILWKMKKADGTLGRKTKILYTIYLVINMISLFLSDSNASLLFIMVYFSFLAFYCIFKGFGKFDFLSFVLRVIATLLACVVTILILFCMRSFTQSCVSLMLTNGESKTQMSNSIKTDNGSVQITDDVGSSSPTTFKHENKNIDSGRFVIWKQALGLFEKFPVMGIGKDNIVSYGKTYLGGLKYDDFHNGLLTIIISFGLVGFTIFMVLAITVAKTFLKAVFNYREKCRQDGSVLVLIVAFCAAYSVYSMFEVALLLDLSYRVFIFWYMIGLGLSYATHYERQGDSKTADSELLNISSAVQSDNFAM